MKEKQSKLYNALKRGVGLFYKKRSFIGLENFPDEPCLVIGNHCQAHGPLTCELYFPKKKKIWCIGQMMKVKEVPAYAYQDFWSLKPKCVRWWFKLLSYLIAPLAAFIFNRADTIAVYKDVRLRTTFRDTENALLDGANVIIFPERAEKHNEIVNEFDKHFVDVARLYYKKHGKELVFLPMYNAPALRYVVFGKPIRYDHTQEIDGQRARICEHIQQELTRVAKELPIHKVVPYENVPKKQYVNSK